MSAILSTNGQKNNVQYAWCEPTHSSTSGSWTSATGPYGNHEHISVPYLVFFSFSALLFFRLSFEKQWTKTHLKELDAKEDIKNSAKKRYKEGPLHSQTHACAISFISEITTFCKKGRIILLQERNKRKDFAVKVDIVLAIWSCH